MIGPGDNLVEVERQLEVLMNGWVTAITREHGGLLQRLGTEERQTVISRELAEAIGVQLEADAYFRALVSKHLARCFLGEPVKKFLAERSVA